MNDSFVMKIVWELCMRPSNVWAKVVRGKYRCGDELKSNINKGRRGGLVFTGVLKQCGTTLKSIANG